MNKIAVLTLLLILFSVSMIANNPLASDSEDPQSSASHTENKVVPLDTMKSNTPMPSPSTLLLIGSGLVGLIIYRKKYKHCK